MIGRHTQIKLNAMGLFTIGDLALTDGVAVARRLGKTAPCSGAVPGDLMLPLFCVADMKRCRNP